MKLSESKLVDLNEFVPPGIFPITNQLVKICYHKCLISSDNKIRHIPSENQRRRLYRKQYEYARRNLLKLKYQRNGRKAKGIKEGFVYAIVNPAYPEHVKIGSAIDVYDRLNSYQTSSPFRDYRILIYFFSHDRLKTEFDIHNKFERDGEWCKVSKEDILELFQGYRKLNSVI